MPPRTDKTGNVYGRLTVTGWNENRRAHWFCRCICGKELSVHSSNLTGGGTKSCGCLRVEVRRAQRHDLSGRRFGRLVVSQYNTDTEKWVCICDCGTTHETVARHLTSGGTVSCGCHRMPHGYAGTPEYKIWSNIPARLRKDTYAAKGIKICDRWVHGENGVHPFVCFLADMGKRPPEPEGWEGKISYWSIERMNNWGDYEPSNCKWATAKEQMNNRF